ncbi:aquaporin-like protein [Xylariaceae sp. FL0594]|nr:aquaporin-like protein [Xylariaceae sp. FL0594]
MTQASEDGPDVWHDIPDLPETPGISPGNHGSSSRLNMPGSRDSRGVMRRESAVSGISAVPTIQRRRAWVDDDYYADNPWFDQQRRKPVFSLGAPLPRKTRWSRKEQRYVTRPAGEGTSKEELAELGEVSPEQSPIPATEDAKNGDGDKHESAQRKKQPRRTSQGVTHGDRYNDADQPVFDYNPEGEDTASTRHAQHTEKSKNEEDKPSYGIDSEPIGRRENEEAEEGDEDPNEYRNWWARVRAKHPEPLAEFLATFIAVFLGLSGSLSVNLSQGQQQQYGTYETACWAFGFAWMFGIYLGGGVSGAHMNPCISVALSLFRGFPWKSCGIYIVAQFLATLSAAALAYGCFRDIIHHVDPTKTDTALTLFSSPPEYVSMSTACFNEVVGSAILVIAIFALGDDQNNPPGAGMHAFILGLLVTTLKFTLGYNVGTAINPATDFGPRVISWAVGYQAPEVFSTGWWIYGPWLSTMAGSIIGGIIYDGFIFVGSESPVNYRVPEKWRKRAKKMVKFGN